MRGILALFVLVGCESAPASWDLTRPVVPPPAPAPAPAPGPPTARAGEAAAPAEAPRAGFDFEGEDRPTDEPVEKGPPEDDVALHARLLGVAMPAQRDPGPTVPDVATSTGTFGVKVISILTDTQPPRAVLGLPSGVEVVVQPGTMIPEAKLVVLAIGRSAVQLAEIVPEGFSTRVVTTTVPALYPVTGAAVPAAP